MVVNSDPDGLLYLMLVEKGYYQPLAFRCLERIKEDFLKFFGRDQLRTAKQLSLNKEFEGAFDRIYVTGGNGGRVLKEHDGQGGAGAEQDVGHEGDAGGEHGEPDSAGRQAGRDDAEDERDE